MSTGTTSDITVPLLDLKAQYATLRPEIQEVLEEVVESQWFIMGPKVQQLETEIAQYCSTSHAVGCASGSDALLLALMACGVGPGDQVICPTFTFFATAGSIHRLGATPIFVDIDPVSYNIDPEGIRQAASGCSSLKAIMPVHLFGQAADLDTILSIGQELNVPVIEDAAQAIGTEDVHGTRVGSRGIAGCFSFFPSKNLGGFGDGGMVTTNDEACAASMSRLRNHGMEPKYYHSEVGLNSRLDALQAAILIVKLQHLDSWSAARQDNAGFYDSMFIDAGASTSAVSMDEGGLPLRTPAPAPEGARHIYNQYVVRVPAGSRDDVRGRLAEANIGTEIYYPLCLHMQECFKDLGIKEGALPHAERAAKETIALPIYPDLTEQQREYVARTLIDIVKSL